MSVSALSEGAAARTSTVAAVAAGNVVPLRRPGAGRSLPTAPAPSRGDWLGQALLDADAVAPGNLLKATIIARREAAPLAEVLLARGWVTPPALRQAVARRWRTGHADLGTAPPDPRLIDAAGIAHCLAHRIVPWRRLGGATLVATSRPEGFEAAIANLPAHFGSIRMVLVEEPEVEAALLATRRTRLIREAELRTPAAMSCRLRDERRTGEVAVLLIGLLALGLAAAPLVLLGALTALALAILASASGMKAIAAVTQMRAAAAAKRQREALGALATTPPELKNPLPVISVMVPMFRESDIAGRLVERLSGLSYPRELTDILLVVEECDTLTRDALAEARLPRWMRVIVVPDGPLRTKPRALNYALNFCRGTIIGVWDAEDWPEAEQLHTVARAFDAAAPEVVCLQGNLDFYNPRTNWLARCFTIEYASWFRVVLSGMARLRLFVPLGGTTLFFRRGPLEQIGAWDAWNVTEDADLGMRLMRRGWRTEMIDTTTHEEANCRPRAWIKQRSRWHKGYFMTWATHMRAPLRLWREIGPRAFLSFQLQMLGTVTAFLIAPVLWTWWMLAAGLGHPLAGPFQTLWAPGLTVLLVLVIGAELVNAAIAVAATREAPRRHLILWIPTMPLYFTLGTFAAWKAIYEVVTQPFYWDKTMHGLHDSSAVPPENAAMPAPDPAIAAVAARGSTASIGLVGRIG